MFYFKTHMLYVTGIRTTSNDFWNNCGKQRKLKENETIHWRMPVWWQCACLRVFRLHTWIHY